MAALARARSASTSRSRGSAVVVSDLIRTRVVVATSSTARLNAASFALDGTLKPLSFLTNCNEASRISSSVAGGSKLNRVLMLLHMVTPPDCRIRKHRTTVPITFVTAVFGRLTFDMRGMRRWAKPAGACPLDGRVRPRARWRGRTLLWHRCRPPDLWDALRRNES